MSLPLSRHLAVKVLANLAHDDHNSVAIQKAGGIPVLLDVVRAGSADRVHAPWLTAPAMRALCNLARNDDNRAVIEQAGGIPVVVDLVRAGGRMLADAVTFLCNLTGNDDSKVAIEKAGGIPVLLEVVSARLGVSAYAMLVRCEAMQALYNLACNDDNKVAIEEAGGISVLVDEVRTGRGEDRENAVRLLCALTARNPTNKIAIEEAAIEEAGGIPVLVDLVRAGTELGREEAAMALPAAKRPRIETSDETSDEACVDGRALEPTGTDTELEDYDIEPDAGPSAEPPRTNRDAGDGRDLERTDTDTEPEDYDIEPEGLLDLETDSEPEDEADEDYDVQEGCGTEASQGPSEAVLSARRQVAQLLAHGVLTVDRANLVQSKANERKQIPGLLETCGVCDYCRKGGKSKGWCRVRKVAQDYRMRYNERLDFANVRMCQEPPRRRVTGSI